MTRDEIDALLPFLANGSLEEAEREEVEAAVAADPALAAELEALRAIRETMQAEEDSYSPGQMGLARLMNDLDAAPANSNAAPRGRLWQLAAAVLFALLLIQSAFLVGGEDEGFTLAGGDTGPTVAFAPDATEAQIRAVLLDAGAVIVDGPSALGLYTLAPLSEDAVDLLRDSPLIESLDLPQ